MSPATQAIEALNRRDLREAMRSGLSWWRTNPTPALAEVLVALEGLTPEAQLDGVSARLGVVISGGNSVKSRANVEALAGDVADPRLTDFLIGVIGAPSFDVSTGNPEAFIASVVELLLRQPDPRVATWRAGLDSFLQARRGTRRGQLSLDEIATIKRIVERLPAERVPRLKRDDHLEAFIAALAPLQRERSDGRDAREGLLRDVVTHFDDARVQVYGDFLSEQGDPQGELIARMVAGEQSGLDALKRKARHPCFGSARLEWEKGFPVKALFADRDGVRSGTWGPELEWGTIRETDVIPLDGCHAERLETLHVGTSWVKDLTRRTQPLPVKTLRLGNLTEGTRSGWNKVKALTAVERVVLTRLDDFAGVLGLLATPTGQRVKVIEVLSLLSRWLLADALPAFKVSSRLEAVSMPGLLLSRTGTLEVTLTNAAETRELVKELRAVKRPLCELVVLKGPEPLTNDPALRSLGTRFEVQAEASTLLSRAKAESARGHLVLSPESGVVFDASALATALDQHRPRSLELDGGVDFAETAASWALAQRAGVEQLTLKRRYGDRDIERGAHQTWYFAPFELTLTRDRSSWVIGAGGPHLVAIAVAGLPRVKLASVQLATVLSREVTALKATLSAHADEVTFTKPDPFTEWTVKFVKAHQRLELRAHDNAEALRPATLDALLALHPKTASVMVTQRTIDFVPWLDWVRTRKLPLDFRLINVRPDGPIRLWWAEGLHVSLTLRHDLIRTLPAALFSVPARQVEHLEFVHFEAIPPAWLEVAKHLAKKHSSRRP